MRLLSRSRLILPALLLLGGLAAGCRTAPQVDGAAVLSPGATGFNVPPAATPAPAPAPAPIAVPAAAPSPASAAPIGNFPRIDIPKKLALQAPPPAPVAPAPAPTFQPGPFPAPAPAPATIATEDPRPTAPAVVPGAGTPDPTTSGVVGGTQQGTSQNLVLEVYRLRPLDQVFVSLRYPVQQSSEDVVDERGFITLPLLGEVKAAGLTTSELEREVTRLYVENKFYKRVIATVVVPTLNYTISGEVNKPGRYEIRGTVTLVQAIAEGGNFTEYADKKKIRIIRSGNILEKNYTDILRDPRLDIEILPRDSIQVPRGW